MGDAPLLYGERFTLEVERDPDDVFAYLVDVSRTPEWRTHLTSVEWMDDGHPSSCSRAPRRRP